jgi:hypothetical protein
MMSAQVGDVRNGILTMTVSGTLSQSELTQVQQAAADIIRAQGKVRILVLAGDFAGWQRGGAWNDFSFQEAFDSCIEKMAIVGDKRWEDLALIFVAKGLRGFPIEYFASGEQDKAQAWLETNP